MSRYAFEQHTPLDKGTLAKGKILQFVPSVFMNHEFVACEDALYGPLSEFAVAFLSTRISFSFYFTYTGLNIFLFHVGISRAGTLVITINTRHVILSTASMRPTDFAAQLNVSLANGWGIIRTVADMCMKMPEGKYVLVKDPNKVGILSQCLNYAF
jgi:hypothetical protein